MLEFSKQILSKVSFDRTLFNKELKKSITWLQHEDIEKLKIWCLSSFAIYNDLITDAFKNFN
ncbi:MAG: hypothetical protein ACJ0QL_05455 [Parvicellaceae bacterium]|tara:strand:+ start:540 stop:725 length:186 start_codon:yes stop_codon:yes gene_type:complete